MRIHGVLVVRDGIAAVRMAVIHHLSLGCERIHAIDNGSTDGTTKVLERLSARTPLSWQSDPGPYVQHEMTTELVHQATRAGADWVLVFDHDEFWVSRRPLREALAELAGAGAAAVRVTNFAQRREVRASSARALLTMDHRAAETFGPVEGMERTLRGSISYLECAYSPKLILRASETVAVQRGAHTAERLPGPITALDGVDCLHAPLIARDRLQLKAEHGERVREAGFKTSESWHLRRWADCARHGTLDAEWDAVSVDADGCVTTADGSRRRFVRDSRLRDTVAPYVRPRFKQATARALGRSY